MFNLPHHSPTRRQYRHRVTCWRRVSLSARLCLVLYRQKSRPPTDDWQTTPSAGVCLPSNSAYGVSVLGKNSFMTVSKKYGGVFRWGNGRTAQGKIDSTACRHGASCFLSPTAARFATPTTPLLRAMALGNEATRLTSYGRWSLERELERKVRLFCFDQKRSLAR